MSQTEGCDYVTKIQVLSLRSDQTIGNLFSPSRMALEKGLSDLRGHRDCFGVYWMPQIEEPRNIVIISKWTRNADPLVSKTYISTLLPHLDLISPPLPCIHIKHPMYTFSRYTTTDFLTLFFPSQKCIHSFLKDIEQRVEAFSSLAVPSYGNPENLVHIESGWIEEPQTINGLRLRRFMICFTWYDRASEKRYKETSPQWRALMDDLKVMGALYEEEYHGEVHKITTGRNKYDPSYGTANEDIGCELVLETTQARVIDESHEPEFKFPIMPLEDNIWESDDESSLSTPILTPSSSSMSLNSLYQDAEPYNAPPESEIFSEPLTKKQLRLREIRQGVQFKQRCPAPSTIDVRRKIISVTDNNEPSPTPLPVPSIKPVSARVQLLEDIVKGVQLKQRYRAPSMTNVRREMISEQESIAPTPLPIPSVNLMFARRQLVQEIKKGVHLRHYQPASAIQKQTNFKVESEWEGDVDLASHIPTAPTSTILPPDLPVSDLQVDTNPTTTIPTFQEAERPTPSNDKHTIPQYGVPRLNADEEVESAKSRFNKYSKRVPALRFQGWAPRSTSPKPDPLPSAEVLKPTETPKKNPSTKSWGNLFKNILTTSSSTTKPDISTEKYIPEDQLFEKHVAEMNEKSYRMPGSFRDVNIVGTERGRERGLRFRELLEIQRVG